MNFKKSNKNIPNFQKRLKQFLSANGLNVVKAAFKVNECCLFTSTEICDSIEILTPEEKREFVKKGFFDESLNELTAKYYLLFDLICGSFNTYPHELSFSKIEKDLKRMTGVVFLEDFFTDSSVVVHNG